MKLRIRGDSIRLRLTRSEVDSIARGEAVAERTHLAGATLEYSLSAGPFAAPEAQFSDGALRVGLPEQVARDWSTSNQVSVDATQETGEGRALRILVEKDFKCLTTRPDEDDSDAFVHPEGPNATHADTQ